MSLNIELLNKIKKQLRAKPARLRMDNWIIKGEPKQVITDISCGYGEPTKFTFPDCGTVGCIAGWAYILARPEDPAIGGYGMNVATYAINDLGIEHHFRPFELFYVTYWPEPYASDYPIAKIQKERVKIVCQVIDLFIKQYQKAEQRYAKAMSAEQKASYDAS